MNALWVCFDYIYVILLVLIIKRPHSVAHLVVENGDHIVSCFPKMSERGPKPKSNVRSLEGHWLWSRIAKQTSSLPILVEVVNTLVPIVSTWYSALTLNFRIHHSGLDFVIAMLKINSTGLMNLHYWTIRIDIIMIQV